MTGQRFSVQYKFLQARRLYQSPKGVTVGSKTFGPHEEWAFAVFTPDRDTFVAEFCAWAESIGAAISSIGYEPELTIVHISVISGVIKS